MRYYNGPTVDQSLLSPSGRMSQRACTAANAREKARLFPPGYWEQSEDGPQEKARKAAEQLRQHALRLRELADRGMCIRKYRKQAVKLERMAAEKDKEATR